MRCCTAPSAQHYRRSRLSELERALRGINTAPAIIQCWKEQIAVICGENISEGMVSCFMSVELKRVLGEARCHQAVLSWFGLLQGRMSVKWSRVQECHERQRCQESASLRRTGTWSAQAVRFLCSFHSDLWSFRNDEVHGRTQQAAQQKLRASVERAVQLLYERNPTLLARYPSIRSCPLSVRLQKPTLVLQMWLKQITRQERITAAVEKKAAMAAGSILPFLVRQRVLGREVSTGRGRCPAVLRVGAKLVRWARFVLRRRSNLELPRAGIGDPG